MTSQLITATHFHDKIKKLYELVSIDAGMNNCMSTMKEQFDCKNFDVELSPTTAIYESYNEEAAFIKAIKNARPRFLEDHGHGIVNYYSIILETKFRLGMWPLKARFLFEVDRLMEIYLEFDFPALLMDNEDALLIWKKYMRLLDAGGDETWEQIIIPSCQFKARKRVGEISLEVTGGSYDKGEPYADLNARISKCQMFWPELDDWPTFESFQGQLAA